MNIEYEKVILFNFDISNVSTSLFLIDKQFMKRLIFFNTNALQFNLYLLDQFLCVGVLSDNHTQT